MTLAHTAPKRSPPTSEFAMEKNTVEMDIPAVTKLPSVQEGVTIERERFPHLASLSSEELAALERRVRRRVDLRLMPMLVLIYIMNYLDRNTIAQAKLGGLAEDLKVNDVQYQACVSILNAGYILMQVPSNIWLNKVGKPALYLSACMTVWGVISACSGVTKNFGGLFACRFCLGFVEAAYYPGCMYTLSVWYKREELSKRMALFYCGSQLSGAFAGLIAAGVVNNMGGLRGLSSWRWLFILEGSLTVLIALFSYLILPNFPATTRWLTDEEREMAIWRLHVDVNHGEWVSSEEQMTTKAFVLVMKDWKNWFLAVMVYCTGASLSINSFFPSVIKTLGRSATETLLLTSPPYLLSCIVMFCVCWNADRTKERYWHFTVPLCSSLAGFIIVGACTQFAARYFGAMIMIPGIYVAFNLAMIWTANTLYAPPAKRATALAFNNAASGLAGLYSAYLFPDNAAPHYALALGVNAGMIFIAICTATVFRFLLKGENKKIEQAELSEPDDSRLVHHRSFRYLY